MQQQVTPWTFYLGDGTQTTFAYAWKILAASELEVYLAGALVTGYTVTGLGVEGGGNIVLFTPPPNGQILFIRRVTPQTQLTDYISNDPFDAAAHEAALDKLTRLVQDTYEWFSRIPKLLVTTANALRHLTFPAPVASKLIGWNSTATALTLYDSALVTITVDAVSGRAFGKTTFAVSAVDNAEELVSGTQIPAGVRCAFVGYRCTIGFGTTRGLTGVTIGGAGIQDRWGGMPDRGGLIGILPPSATGHGHALPEDVSSPNVIPVSVYAMGGKFDGTGACKLTSFWETAVADS